MSAGGRANIHGSLVLLEGTGILIRGEAQSGKSSLVLSLLRAAAREGREAALVADDRVELTVVEGRLRGAAPASLFGLLEIGGVGIVRIGAAASSAAVDLVVDLAERPERLPEPLSAELLGTSFRRLVLPAREASLSADILLTLLAPGNALVTDAPELPPADDSCGSAAPESRPRAQL